MRPRHTCPERSRRALPHLWLVSDERNDSELEAALRRLPPGSGFVFRHHHMAPRARFARWLELRRLARRLGHLVILAGNPPIARAWGADGVYGAPRTLHPARGGLLTVVTAHDLREVGSANRRRAGATMLSPVFATRSHPGAHTLGVMRFRLLAAHAEMPVIALGGMTRLTARRLAWPRWAAIDGLSSR